MLAAVLGFSAPPVANAQTIQPSVVSAAVLIAGGGVQKTECLEFPAGSGTFVIVVTFTGSGAFASTTACNPANFNSSGGDVVQSIATDANSAIVGASLNPTLVNPQQEFGFLDALDDRGSLFLFFRLLELRRQAAAIVAELDNLNNEIRSENELAVHRGNQVRLALIQFEVDRLQQDDSFGNAGRLLDLERQERGIVAGTNNGQPPSAEELDKLTPDQKAQLESLQNNLDQQENKVLEARGRLEELQNSDNQTKILAEMTKIFNLLVQRGANPGSLADTGQATGGLVRYAGEQKYSASAVDGQWVGPSSFPSPPYIGNTAGSGRSGFRYSLADYQTALATSQILGLAPGDAAQSLLTLDNLANIDLSRLERQLRFNAWVSGDVSRYDDSSGAVSQDGTRFRVAAGASYAVTPTARVGAAFRYVRADSSGGATSHDANYYSGALYASFAGVLPFAIDGLVAYEIGKNDLTSNGGTGSFDSDNVIFSVRVHDRVYFDPGFWLEPSLNLSYALADRDGYTDTIGNVIASGNLDQGNITFGAAAGKLFVLNDGFVKTVEPYASVYGVGELQRAQGSERFGVAVSAGAGLRLVKNVGLSASGRYYRLGSDFDTISANAVVTIPLN